MFRVYEYRVYKIYLQGVQGYTGCSRVYRVYEVWKVNKNRSFSHDVPAAILVYQNNETAAMLVYQEKTRLLFEEICIASDY